VTRVYLDTETYSEVDLKKSNVYRYSEDPSFEILLLGYAIDDDPVAVIDNVARIRHLLSRWRADTSVTFVAHNAGFDRVVLSRVLGLLTGTYLDPAQWDDTAARAAVQGYPRGLAALATALGVTAKDTAGTRLINIFSKPQREGRIRPEDSPERFEQFRQYCGNDVETLREVDRALLSMPETERQFWLLDQRINDRGIAIDGELAEGCREVATLNAGLAKTRLRDLTGLDNPNSTAQLRGWLADHGCPLPDMQARTLNELSRDNLAPEVRKALALRAEIAVASSNKFDAAVRGVSHDGRLRGQFTYHEALTGRWSSKGVQLHNLPRESFSDRGTEGLAIADIRLGLGADMTTLKQLVRPMLIVNGCVSDFASIEARVLAWLAGEQWVLDAFAAGRDLYTETATLMGPTITRAQGKIAVLACGYQGSIGSLRAQGYGGLRRPDDAEETQVRGHRVQGGLLGVAQKSALGSEYKSDEELRQIVEAWRQANPNIVTFWRELESAFRLGGAVGDKIVVRRADKDRFVRLPSGRVLCYRDVSTRGDITYAHVRGQRATTYGGKLTENVTQAVARDLLADALVRLDAAGYPIIGHVHDEVLIESDDPQGVLAIMRTGPAWATGLPLDASADSLYRYAKK